MNRRHCFGMLALLLSSCQPGSKLDITVKAPNSIIFTLDEAECIENLRIIPQDGDGDTPSLWEIEAAQPKAKGETMACVKSITFPTIPLGFELVSPPSSALLPGNYVVTGHAGIYWLSGDFTVEAR